MSEQKVKLIRHTPEPEKAVAAAAKLCYSDIGAMELEENLSDEDAGSFIAMLMNMGHMSPIEHAVFTFAIEGVSRALSHQLVRHRIASYSQQSQRYVTEDSFDYVIPPSINESPEALEIFSKALEAIQTAYNELRGILAPEFEKQLIAEGQTEKKAKDNAEKMANEDARFVLPNATETKLVFTMNARELLHFFGQRCCNRAQWEIRSLAEEMVVILKPIAPTIFKNAGPPCLRGACPEGSMSCGKQAQVALRYKMLDERL